MGFGSFLSEAFGAVKNLVTHSPIVKALAPLGGIIAHAVPMVGPIIDNAIPAIEAIFSKDNTAPNAGEDPKPPTSEQLSAPVLVELKQQQGNIEAILKTVQTFQSSLHQSFEDLKKEFDGKLDMNLEETLKALAIDKYDELFTVVRSSVAWFQNNQAKLSITAQDGPDKFEPLLSGENNLLSHQSELATLTAQALSVRLTLSEQAIVVTRGIYARALYVKGEEWLAYLNALNTLSNDINELRNDAINARDVLQSLITNVPGKREEMIQLVTPDSGQPYIQDNWPTLSVGSIPLNKLMVELGVKDEAIKSQKALLFDTATSSLAYSLWKTFAVQALQFNLEPARTVMNHLEESSKGSIDPEVAPIKKLPDGQDHVKASIVSAKETVKEIKSLSLEKEKLVGKELRYALTYYNTYGESYSSSWTTNQCLIDKNTRVVKLEVHPIKFDNDPLDALEPIKMKGKAVAPQRSIRRKLYVNFTENHGHDVVLYLGDIGEDENVVYHMVNEKESG
ncbi:hypothetical protein FE257_011150 [Aspergillus nanangensis]|uniref:Uncharacterized protein n=1 Tax=Aspergillus nanangensis TaxID=2582783 RepID=A0AAD4CJ84_ASPNN|nr:hypothetical protein FE257_011150 [Aspergillus nanangensis]